jgi:signal transduction histidine kinase
MLDEQGLVCAIRWYLSGFVKRSGIRVDLSVSSDFGRLPRRVERTLFLVVQECLTNVYRHAASDVARVDLRRSGHYVVVEISDEGDRLSSEQRDALQKAVGVGIRSIRERLQIIGGKFELQPQDKGLRAIATVPFISRSEGRANPDRG